MKKFRIESDSLGEVSVPADAYYGAQTQRAFENFAVSGKRMPREFIRALGIIKWAAAEVNEELGYLDHKIAEAIGRASREVMEGAFDHDFVVDVYQTGSGTSTNMNANEIIANRANELLGGKRGSKVPVHPNDHVNKSQSSNDVIPSTIHISGLESIEKNLLPALKELYTALHDKSKEFDAVLKIGRTHLQDAVPIRLGQEFSGYAVQIKHAVRRVESSCPYLRELALGGTAVGTGLNAPAAFAPLAIQKISAITGIPFVKAENYFEALAGRDAVVETSGHLKTVAVSLLKIANDLRWLNSGPRCAIGEIILPSLQPGSSIMPGKVNPVIPESIMMLCATVIGNDSAITIGGQHGNFELNTMMPMIAYHLLESIRLLAQGSHILVERCIAGIQANRERAESLIENSLAMCTALAPIIGYDAAGRIATEAFSTGKTVRQVALEHRVLPEKQLNRILNPRTLTKPGISQRRAGSTK
ncbi:MAG TPA: class II fumarate hydratase [Thermodesulfobacteriota bacterium]|nr:class II fumarate hydratase [Thermodesulfobacteriota bacterium]